jgi:hypothetical protein
MSGIGFRQGKAAPHAKPGNWNDPDMLIVGQVGWGNLHPTRLNADEQYTHISLWCLLSAPLLIGCDMEKFDAFTLNLLSNDEVLALDQDARGQEATCVWTNNANVRLYVKPLEDGGRAAGFFNLGSTPANLDFNQFAPIGFRQTSCPRSMAPTGFGWGQHRWRQLAADDSRPWCGAVQNHRRTLSRGSRRAETQTTRKAMEAPGTALARWQTVASSRRVRRPALRFMGEGLTALA